MGSEMCIRDRGGEAVVFVVRADGRQPLRRLLGASVQLRLHILVVCLLYTSDAADERSSVDLGGRRIIKKKMITADVCRFI